MSSAINKYPHLRLPSDQPGFEPTLNSHVSLQNVGRILFRARGLQRDLSFSSWTLPYDLELPALKPGHWALGAGVPSCVTFATASRFLLAQNTSSPGSTSAQTPLQRSSMNDICSSVVSLAKFLLRASPLWTVRCTRYMVSEEQGAGGPRLASAMSATGKKQRAGSQAWRASRLAAIHEPEL